MKILHESPHCGYEKCEPRVEKERERSAGLATNEEISQLVRSRVLEAKRGGWDC